jgi:hypothetical protein
VVCCLICYRWHCLACDQCRYRHAQVPLLQQRKYSAARQLSWQQALLLLLQQQ